MIGSSISEYDRMGLLPLVRPLIFTHPKFSAPTETSLIVSEKISINHDDFTIKDLSGVAWFKCSRKIASLLSQKKTLLDVNGTPILNIKAKYFTILKSFMVYAGDKTTDLPITNIKNKFQLGGSTMIADATTIEGTRCQLVMLAGLIGRHAYIFLGHPKKGGQLIAKVSQKLTGKEILFGVDKYCLSVAPNVDIALMVAMCIAYDEIRYGE